MMRKKAVSILGLNNEKRWCSFYNDDEDDVTNYIDDENDNVYILVMLRMAITILLW